MYNHKIVNTITGEETITELSKAEIKVIEANIAQSKIDAVKAEAKAAAKAAAQAKLAALGLTVEDLQALGL